MSKNNIQKLEALVLKHKELYYVGKAEISDEAYDKLEDELRALDPENPVLQLVGHKSVDRNLKVQHQKKMLSLDKTYNKEDIYKWQGEEEIVSIFKLDGSSCSLLYQRGHLVLAKTRGDGQFGENISNKALYIPEIPKYIPNESLIEIRGEVYCTESQFFHLSEEMKQLGLEAPTSQRNIVAGLLGRKENIHLAKYLSFKAFDLIIETKFNEESQKLEELKKYGFHIPEYEIHKTNKSIDSRIAEAKEFMGSGDYLIDGIVFIYNKLKLHEELGETSHHPRYKIAFKFMGDTKSTKLLEIEWGVSRNGLLTPVGIVEPVELSGAMIGRVSLHNFGLVRSFELKSGDEIEIIRSGEVIPKFLGVVKKSQNKFNFPDKCPSCHSVLVIQDIWLMCINKNCPAKIKEEILNYIQKSGIDDLSDKRLEEMMSKGLVKKISDLYDITIERLLLLDKVKEKMANKMYENIQKTKNQSLVQFISAIGVEGVSTAKSEKIISHGHNSIEKIQNLTIEELVQIEGFAEKSSTDIVNSIKKKKTLISQLIKAGVKVKADAINTGEGPLAGQKFCITGELTMPRAEFEKLIKSNGGIMVSSVSKNTSFLVTNEENSSSSKFVKANTLGIRVITEKKLLKMLEG